MDFDLFVIGGGSAGVRCGRIAAGHGARVAVAEERFWGGTCVNVGCVPKKLLVQAGEYGGWADDAAGFGWTIKKGPHDWAKLIAAKDREIGRLNAIYRRLLDNAGAKIFDARAVLIDPHTLEVDGKHVTAERIVIATGGHAVRVPFPGSEHAIISDDAFYLPAMPRARRGAGLGLHRGGIRRHLRRARCPGGPGVPPAAAVARLRPGYARGVAEALTAQGVTLHPGCTPRALEPDGDEKVLTLSNGSGLTRELVFSALGRAPSTAGLGLDKAGVATNRRGDRGRASAHQPAAHLRHRRRDRPAESDAGRHRRGPRVGRLRCSASTRGRSRCRTCRPRCSPPRRSRP